MSNEKVCGEDFIKLYWEYLSWYGNLKFEYQIERQILTLDEFCKLSNKTEYIDNIKKILYN